MPAQNLSKLSVIQPTIFASGLHDTAVGLSGSSSRTRYNSSVSINSGDSSSNTGKKRNGGLIIGSRNSNRPKSSSNNNDNNGVGAPGTAGDLEERQKQQDSGAHKESLKKSF